MSFHLLWPRKRRLCSSTQQKLLKKWILVLHPAMTMVVLRQYIEYEIRYSVFLMFCKLQFSPAMDLLFHIQCKCLGYFALNYNLSFLIIGFTAYKRRDIFAKEASIIQLWLHSTLSKRGNIWLSRLLFY